MYILVLLFVANDAWIYKTPIAKITHVKEEQTASRKAVRGGKELYYKQTMEARILNFCANNYLGLSDNPRLIEAAKKAMDNRGYGMSSEIGRAHV